LVKERLTPIDAIDVNVAGQESSALAREIAEHAITLVRNDDKLVPLSALKREARIFNLAITNGDDRLWISNAFGGALTGAGLTIETLVLDDRSSEAEVQKVLERAQRADLVIASLYGRVRTGQARSVGLPEPGAKALAALLGRRLPLVGISFGNPYLLQSFPELRTYLVAYGDMPSLQEAAARALTGEIDVTGKLPISLPGLYPRGTGIQLKRIR
jgi:beta-N-acetylhexosaminidase